MKSTTIEIAAPLLRAEVEVGKLWDVQRAVAAFGLEVHATHPGVSFMVMASIRPGSGRKPAGFDHAARSGALSQDAWMKVVS